MVNIICVTVFTYLLVPIVWFPCHVYNKHLNWSANICVKIDASKFWVFWTLSFFTVWQKKIVKRGHMRKNYIQTNNTDYELIMQKNLCRPEWTCSYKVFADALHLITQKEHIFIIIEREWFMLLNDNLNIFFVIWSADITLVDLPYDLDFWIYIWDRGHFYVTF